MAEGNTSATASGPSNLSRPPAPAFQPAKTLLSSSTTASGSLRNASSSGSNGGGMTAPAGASSTGGSTSGTSGSNEATPPAGEGAGTAAVPVAPTGPVKPVHRNVSSKNAIVYNAVQRKNPVLSAIKNVPTEIGDIPADYQVGTHNGVLFLSLKYHRLHPEYIHQRIEKMRGIYQLRILMILCDISEHQLSLRELSKIAIVNNLSTIVAWSADEIAQYLTTFKQFEHKSADTLKEKVHQTYHDQLQHVLTSGKKVNKTDAFNMASQFGSFANMSSQSAKMIATVKGLGPTKVNTLVDAFSKPFLVGGLKRTSEEGGSGGLESGGITSAMPGSGANTSEPERPTKKAKGKEKAIEEETAGSEERMGSPDWPEEEEEDEGEAARDVDSPVDTSENGSNRVNGAGKGSEVWRDPLEDDEPDSDPEPDELTVGGGDQRGKRRPSELRRRLSGSR